MNGARARRWLWSLMRFAVAASLVSFAAGALHDTLLRDFEDYARRGVASLMPARKPVRSGDERPLPDGKNLRSSITVDVSPGMLRGTYMLRLQKNDPLFLQLQHKIADAGSDRYLGSFLDQYVGFVGFGGHNRVLSPKTASFEVNPQSNEALVIGSLDAEEIPEDEITDRSLALSVDIPWHLKSGEGEAIFRGHGVEVRPLGRQPVEQSASPEETVLRFRRDDVRRADGTREAVEETPERGPHRSASRRHHPASAAARSRCQAASPRNARSNTARRHQRWRSNSQVKPMPPWSSIA